MRFAGLSIKMNIVCNKYKFSFVYFTKILLIYFTLKKRHGLNEFINVLFYFIQILIVISLANKTLSAIL